MVNVPPPKCYHRDCGHEQHMSVDILAGGTTAPTATFSVADNPQAGLLLQ